MTVQQVATPPQRGEIGQILLDQLNSSVIDDFTTMLTPAMIIDNPLATYTKLVGQAMQPNKFKNALSFKAIVLASVASDASGVPYIQFLNSFYPSRFLPSEGKTTGYFCMIPELFACLPNPFNFLYNQREYFKRSFRHPYFEVGNVSTSEVPSALENIAIGSIVDVQFDNTNYATGLLTKLVMPANLNDVLLNSQSPASAFDAFNSGDALLNPNTKLAAAAARTGYTEPDLNTMVQALVPYGTFMSDYGNRMHPIDHIEKMHDGIDISANQGEAVLAAHDSYVKSAVSSNTGYGVSVELESADGKVITKYSHLMGWDDFVEKALNSTDPDASPIVFRGQTIGFVGSTGASTGPHLHFEVRQGGAAIDPWDWLADQNGIPTPAFAAEMAGSDIASLPGAPLTEEELATLEEAEAGPPTSVDVEFVSLDDALLAGTLLWDDEIGGYIPLPGYGFVDLNDIDNYATATDATPLPEGE